MSSTPDSTAPPTGHAAFERHRGHCFAIAYRMLGCVADAEDLVQETWLRYSRHADTVREPKAFLTSVTTRLAIDRLRAQSRSRETYTGPWLPEPLVADAPPQTEAVDRAESVSMAFLVVLEQLSPVERAVFLLRSVFERDYEDIAAIVGKQVANCRQIYARARRHVDAGRPRFEVARDEHLAVLAAFAQAAQTNDVDGLVAVLDPDARLISDGGGKISAALKPLVGPTKIVRFLLGVAQLRAKQGETSYAPRFINGRPGALVYLDGELDSTLSVDVVGGKIVGIQVVRNPDKLRHLQAEAQACR